MFKWVKTGLRWYRWVKVVREGQGGYESSKTKPGHVLAKARLIHILSPGYTGMVRDLEVGPQKVWIRCG